MVPLYLCLVFVCGRALAQTDDALSVYKTGDYKAAIPLLREAAAKTPKEATVQAALLSALVYEGQADAASEAAETDATQFPDSPDVIAARGEFAFYMGDMPEAERLFKASLKIKETARACYGLCRLYRMASFHRSARILAMRAHELDPDDPLIMVAFLNYATPERRKTLLDGFESAHPGFTKRFYKNLERNRETAAELKHEIDGRKVFEFAGDPRPTTLPLKSLLNDSTHIRGFGLDVTIQGGRRLRMLLDTGASGLVITQAAADREGLAHVGSFETSGIGDKGPRTAFAAVAETCSIGTLEYKTCIFDVLAGKGRIAGDEDGLIGTDFFANYIVQLDFQKRLLTLTPQPARPPNPQGYNREIPPNEKNFTPIFRYGHELLISTMVNGRSTGLFLLDTGAEFSNIDSTFARLSTKIHGNDYMHVKGISGSVKDVFEADKAELQFGHFRQRNLGLTSFNLNNTPDHREFRMAGIMGLPILALFRLTIDYRNGLVNFDYILK